MKVVIGSCFVDKTKNDPLRPLYQMLDKVGKAIERQDCLDTRMSVEVVCIELAANLYEHSDSRGYECTVDCDVDGITVCFIDYTAAYFKPKQILEPTAAERALALIEIDKRGRGLLMVMAVSNYVTFRENSTVVFLRWKTEDGQSCVA